MPENVRPNVVVLRFAVLFGAQLGWWCLRLKSIYDANLTAERVKQENVGSSLKGSRQILRDTIYFFEFNLQFVLRKTSAA